MERIQTVQESLGGNKSARKKRLQTVLRNVTKEMYRRNYELAQTNRILNLLRQVDSLALESHESPDIFCQKLAQAIVVTADLPFVSIITRPTTSRSIVRARGIATSLPLLAQPTDMLAILNSDYVSEWYEAESLLKIIDLDHLRGFKMDSYSNEQTQKQKIQHLLDNLKGIKSVALIKLKARNKSVGILLVGFQVTSSRIEKNDVELIERLGESLGVAVDSKLLFEENQRVLLQLQKANDKLKALDEAKDDFISMASHQLRTPLTSVKGYISMLLEEDAGKTNKRQREMLTQAFFSSQRMVYLIADLLNVSRLKTGKFVIVPSIVNLLPIVQQEVDQLAASAHSRTLELTFKKPPTFPDLMLDETKIRQVIMNFIDNAIYYTPPGGHITVSLNNKPHTVELTVEDDGIGVPKSDQHLLFTKFYRAGNARQARPDGTGLGLFMAKKVIVAEGGATIFDSQEGKGSTFGFVFSKAKYSPTRLSKAEKPFAKS